jgi:hypothetical protein
VVELDLPGGVASPAFGIDEATTPIVAHENLSAIASRNRSRLSAVLLPSRSRLLGERCLSFFGFRQQRIQRSI